MIDIAKVIAWKFDNQEGMSTKNNIITEFPGGIPSQSDQDTWIAEYEVAKTEMDQAKQDTETQKANDKISAQNKLKALGLTDAEIEAL
tara:strand:+ start:528 stop:791 length:264 start_codon:yes stop_codon:yes gene_type:complete